MTTETFSPIGTLLKFLDPSYSPLAVPTIGGSLGIFCLKDYAQHRWWPIALTIFAVLLWALITARSAVIREINPTKRSKELGLPIALVALISIAALVAATDGHGGIWSFAFVLLASITQLAAVHILIRLDRKDFFLHNRFHVTQYCWIVAALFAGAVFSALTYQSAEHWRTEMPKAFPIMACLARQSVFTCVVFAALWVIAIQKVFSLLFVRTSARDTNP